MTADATDDPPCPECGNLGYVEFCPRGHDASRCDCALRRRPCSRGCGADLDGLEP